ncbi:hypothetical protein WICMUC_003455 [Wickerhamomyces mucosus]|uniref:Enhancer of translation termination 1 n=1 Tax=Wickerhamomyces mucosus TaxID=1378264 RepID=A0A9P8PL92_9ASCO|nr:hypothetical protein WICMUC_003455 [Wickerhamomyces mucosus]
MAKRTLGLGKAAKQKKKQKTAEITPEVAETDGSASFPNQPSNEITVELDEEVDPDDELAQLKGLWNTYLNSAKDSEHVLNGIIHESDRLLRNQSDEDASKLSAEFHSIYALSLAELAIFHTEDQEKGSTVKEFFDAALERIELGQEQFPDSIELKFAKAKIILNRIPLEYISKMTLDSASKEFEINITKLLDDALNNYEEAEESVILLKNYSLLDRNIFEILNAFDDLLDIVYNFGKVDELAEGLDSDEEEDDLNEQFKLSKKHPLYKIQQNGKYSQWIQEHSEKFADLISLEYDHLLKKSQQDLSEKESNQISFLKLVSKKTGQLLLQSSEPFSNIFTTLTYDSDNEESEIDGLDAIKAQKLAIDLTKRAIKFFEKAEEEEEPQSWVDVAEAVISLGNLYDYESKEQNESYKIAEKRLKRANNATNGKYQKILDNLINNDDDDDDDDDDKQ